MSEHLKINSVCISHDYTNINDENILEIKKLKWILKLFSEVECLTLFMKNGRQDMSQRHDHTFIKFTEEKLSFHNFANPQDQFQSNSQIYDSHVLHPIRAQFFCTHITVRVKKKKRGCSSKHKTIYNWKIKQICKNK